LTDSPGKGGTEAIIGLDELLTEGTPGKILVPEALQQNHFLGHGGAVGCGGYKAKLLFDWFIEGIFFCQFCGGLRRYRCIELYWGYFGNIGEIIT